MVWFAHTEHHCGTFQNSQLDDQNVHSGSPSILKHRSTQQSYSLLQQTYAVQTSYSEFYLSQLFQCLIFKHYEKHDSEIQYGQIIIGVSLSEPHIDHDKKPCMGSKCIWESIYVSFIPPLLHTDLCTPWHDPCIPVLLTCSHARLSRQQGPELLIVCHAMMTGRWMRRHIV